MSLWPLRPTNCKFLPSCLWPKAVFQEIDQTTVWLFGMQINHPIWPFGLVKLSGKKKSIVTLAQRPPMIKVRELLSGHNFSSECFLLFWWLTSFGSGTVMWVSLHCGLDRERLLKYLSPLRARFQQEKMKVVKANLENQELQWIFSLTTSEGINESNHSGIWMTNQNRWVWCFCINFSTSGVEGNFCTFPLSGSHTHTVHTSVPSHHRTPCLKSPAQKSFYAKSHSGQILADC